MSGSPSAITSRIIGALMAGWLSLCAGCSSTPKPVTDFASREEAEDFRSMLLANARVVADDIKRTEKGENLSEMAIGWLVIDILLVVSSQDAALYNHFTAGGGDIQSYLTSSFSRRPDAEMAAIDAMAAADPSPLCSVARSGLEVLRHIPDPSEPAQVQQRDRSDLVASLIILDARLQKAAAAVEFPDGS